MAEEGPRRSLRELREEVEKRPPRSTSTPAPDLTAQALAGEQLLRQQAEARARQLQEEYDAADAARREAEAEATALRAQVESPVVSPRAEEAAETPLESSCPSAVQRFALALRNIGDAISDFLLSCNFRSTVWGIARDIEKTYELEQRKERQDPTYRFPDYLKPAAHKAAEEVYRRWKDAEARIVTEAYDWALSELQRADSSSKMSRKED